MIFEGLPDVRCRGLCWESCSNVPMNEKEISRASLDLGRLIGMLPDGTCNALVGGRCGVYLNRPLICRLWGGAEGMECPHGCEVVGDPVARADGFNLLAALREHEGPSTVRWVAT